MKSTSLLWLNKCCACCSIIMPRPRRGGGIINCPRSFVRLSVCSVPRQNSRTERPRNLGSPKLGGWKPITRVFSEPEVKRSKVKVTRPINAHTVNVQYLPNGKASELQTWYTDGARRPASATSVVTFKVKGQGREVTWCVWQVLAYKSESESESESECKCLTCNQKPTGSQFSLLHEPN